jgi:Mor family transcriptional regulator
MRPGENELAGSLLESLASVTAEKLQISAGMDEVKARKIGEAVATEFANREGGVMMYIPKGLAEKRFVRDLEIKAKFNGANYVELAQAYGVSEMRIRQILGRKNKK